MKGNLVEGANIGAKMQCANSESGQFLNNSGFVEKGESEQEGLLFQKFKGFFEIQQAGNLKSRGDYLFSGADENQILD